MSVRRAVVTGASSGIGESTVRMLRASGWHVVGVARRADRLASLAEQTGAETFVADLSRPADVEALRAHLASGNPIHALVNVAGGAIGTDSVENGSDDDWARMFEINVLATRRVTSALLPLLRRGAVDSHADIVTVTSTAGHAAYEGGGGYNAAKFGERALVNALRLELAGEPIRVVEVAPGMVYTPEFTLNRLGGDAEKAAAVYDGVEYPLVADDVAEVIVHSLGLPGHVNLDLIVMRPVAQAAQHKLVRGPLNPRV